MLWRLGKRDRFWQWFEASRPRFEAAQGRIDARKGSLDGEALALIDECHRALAKVDRRLAPLVGRAADGVLELTITADGNAAAFPAVFDLVRAAPDLAGWRFIPLKPREPVIERIEAGGVCIDVTALHYFVNRSGELPAILLLSPTEIDGEHWNTWQFLAEMMLASMLGEHELATGVGAFAIVSRAKFEESWGHSGTPIAALPAEFPPRRTH